MFDNIQSFESLEKGKLFLDGSAGWPVLSGTPFVEEHIRLSSCFIGRGSISFY